MNDKHGWGYQFCEMIGYSKLIVKWCSESGYNLFNNLSGNEKKKLEQGNAVKQTPSVRPELQESRAHITISQVKYSPLAEPSNLHIQKLTGTYYFIHIDVHI